MVDDIFFTIKSIIGFGSKSQSWKHWISVLDLKTCEECRSQHGKIYAIEESVSNSPPLHMNCRCEIKLMNTITSGKCSNKGQDGADWCLMFENRLPEYYISKDDLLSKGCYYGKDPSKYAPGTMVFGGIFRNDDGLLPEKEGRVWFEADINYISGRRNGHRLLWSNDGLFFVTYNHYQTFIEVVGG